MNRSGGEPVGAALVVGGGIGGMQAALDLAESGFKVYLVEERSAIGGRMAQLDKTFPTNDCAMCIVSPKLVQVGRHPDVEILTRTRVAALEGEAGRFTVRLRQEPRFVDLASCTGCGDCARVCPVERPNEYNRFLESRRAIYKRYPQAIPGAYAIEKRGTAPCRLACPAGVAVQGYVRLIREGRYHEALAVIRRNNPFPAICGRVCSRPCEAACRRGEVDEPVAIRDLKRFAADVEMELGPPRLPGPATERPERVAVVGAGPAGLTAAYFLRQQGYRVTLLEAGGHPGGAMASGIPRYRLPRDVLEWEVEAILSTGIEVRYGARLGDTVTLEDLEQQGFQAVLVATGASRSGEIDLPGRSLDGIHQGLEVLTRINARRPPHLGRRLLVVGGGNVAMDVARAAVRLGVERVTVACLEAAHEMPADPEEVEEALEEGVDLLDGRGPAAFLGEGRVSSVSLRRCTRVFDEQGSFSPIYDDSDTVEVEADSVVLAIGSRPDLSVLDKVHLRALAPDGRLRADPTTMGTDVPGLFVAGDLLTGPRTVIEAVGAGREAAISIDRHLRGEAVAAGRRPERPEAIAELEGVEREPRHQATVLEPDERCDSNAEVRSALDEDAARAEAARCLSCGLCSECGLCVEACKAGAIRPDELPRELELEVGSIVLAPGFEQFEAAKVGEYGYGVAENVVTSLELERLLSATGPTGGHVHRPSDGKVPGRVAWVQCVGSRDQRSAGYCSGVCCMFAAKQAVIARDHHAELAATIFCMDVRAHGKGFDAYVERARDRYGVRYVHCQISRVEEMPDSRALSIAYVNEAGEHVTEEFDLVVLSTGLRPSPGVRELGANLGVELDRDGFCRTEALTPVTTNVPGIFVCGVFQGPKDIPETVAQASGAAAYAGEVLAPARGTLVSRAELPQERPVEGEEPRVGVFVCRCGINIAGVVDVPRVVEQAARLPGVVWAGEALFTCSQDNQERMRDLVREHRLNRVVVASCSPRTHEPLFQQTLRETGLNPFLFSMANIRDQCSWVHGSRPRDATEKAIELVRMATANARCLHPLRLSQQQIRHRALVVGGGLAGMTAALRIAGQGYPVTLVERGQVLGGGLRHIRTIHDGTEVAPALSELVAAVEGHPLVDLLLRAEVVGSRGFLGNFATDVRVTGEALPVSVEHGVTVLATGAQERRPTEHLYGEDERVVTGLELETLLAEGRFEGPDAPRSVVMIQCVGSRDDERPYCSRVCCTQAIKNALTIRKISPRTRVFVLFRDVRTYGLRERYYNEARRQGVIFIRYRPEAPPRVTRTEDGLSVAIDEPVVGGDVALPADLVVLSSAIVPHRSEVLSEAFKVQSTAEGFFLEAHMKLQPVEFSTAGVFLAGLAHGPKPVDETVAQAAAAASRAVTLLSRESLEVGGVVSRVEPDLCAACLCCVRACPYEVPAITDEGHACIEEAECRGCGLCAAECPGKAIELQHFTDRQILEICQSLSPGEPVAGQRG